MDRLRAILEKTGRSICEFHDQLVHLHGLRQQLAEAADAVAAAGSTPTSTLALQALNICLPPRLVDDVGTLRANWPLLTAAAGFAPTLALQALNDCLPSHLIDLVGALEASWSMLTAGAESTGSGMEWEAKAAVVRGLAVRSMLAPTPPSVGPTSSGPDNTAASATPVQFTPPADGSARLPIAPICEGGNLHDELIPGGLPGGRRTSLD